MTNRTTQITSFVSARPCRIRNHHRSCQENANVTNTNPFARRPGGGHKPRLGRRLSRRERWTATEKVKIRKTNPFVTVVYSAADMTKRAREARKSGSPLAGSRHGAQAKTDPPYED